MSEARVSELTKLVDQALDQALDYRGFVTVTRHDGTRQVGFIYARDRTCVEMFDEEATTRLRVALDQIAGVELTGEDCAAAAQRRWARRRALPTPPEPVPPVLFLVALRSELTAVAQALGAPVRSGVVRGRLGDHPAIARAVGVGGGAAQAIAAEQPSAVICCGFSGALDPRLPTGAVVLASSIEDELGASFAGAAPWLGAARRVLEPAAEGAILCTTEVAATGAEKCALARPGRLAVDLESGPAARAAVRAGLPWVVVRVILDPLALALPAFAREVRQGYVAPALRHALRGPRAAAELAGLALRARTARRALAGAVRQLEPALATLTGRERSP